GQPPRSVLAAAVGAAVPEPGIVRALLDRGAVRADAFDGERTLFEVAAAHPGLLEILTARPLEDPELPAALAAASRGAPLPWLLDWPLDTVRASVEALGLRRWIELAAEAGPEELRRALDAGPTSAPTWPAG